MRQGIRERVVIARDVMKGRMKVFKEEAPTENVLAVKRSVSQILMIGPHVKVTTTKQHHAKLFEGFDDGKEFFLHGGIVVLRSVELATIESNGALLLDDDGT